MDMPSGGKFDKVSNREVLVSHGLVLCKYEELGEMEEEKEGEVLKTREPATHRWRRAPRPPSSLSILASKVYDRTTKHKSLKIPHENIKDRGDVYF